MITIIITIIIIIIVIIIKLYKCVLGFGRFRLLLHSGARTSLPLTRSVKEDLLEGVVRDRRSLHAEAAINVSIWVCHRGGRLQGQPSKPQC